VNSDEIYIERQDMDKFSGQKVGLIGLCSVKLGKKSEFISEKIDLNQYSSIDFCTNFRQLTNTNAYEKRWQGSVLTKGCVEVNLNGV
jgi:hypothetical protein